MTRPSAKTISIAIIALAVVAAAVWVGVRGDNGDGPGALKGQYKVALFSYVTHPVLDQVRAATEANLNTLAVKNSARITFAYFNAEGSDSQITLLSQTILQGDYDVIVPIATPVSRQVVVDAPPMRRVVYSFVTNPENLGKERFDKNVTGVSDAVNYPANVDTLFAWLPNAKRIGFLYNPGEPNSIDALNRTKPLVAAHGATLVVAPVTSGEEVATIAAGIAPSVDAFYVGGDNTVVGQVPSLVAVARQNNRPVFASDSGSVESGAVAAVSVDYAEIGKETGQVVWRVIHGGREPKAISPVSVPGTKAIFNPEAAAAFGLKPPVTTEFEFTPVQPAEK